MSLEEMLYTYSLYKPVITVVLILINIAVFLMETVAGGSTNTDVAIRFGAQYSPYVKRGQWWRLITSMFMHFGIMHLIFNMYSLYSLGSAAEYMLGGLRYVLLYLASGLCGNLSTLLVENRTHNYTVSAGASGAIFGLMGFYLVLAILPEYRQFVSTGNIMINLVINLLNGFMNKQINMKAHLGGLAGGILITLIFLA